MCLCILLKTEILSSNSYIFFSFEKYILLDERTKFGAFRRVYLATYVGTLCAIKTCIMQKAFKFLHKMHFSASLFRSLNN